MSIDIEILPTVDKEIQWGILKELILHNAADSKRSLLDNLKLIDVKNNSYLDEADFIRSDRGYLFKCEDIKTLTVAIIEKDDADSDKSFIDDFGCNLSSDDRKKILDKWEIIPYTVYISSGANRSSTEIELIGSISAGVAEAYNGSVVVSENNFFNLGKGIYSPEEFALARRAQ